MRDSLTGLVARYNAYLQKFYTDVVDFGPCHYVFTIGQTLILERVRNESVITMNCERASMYSVGVPTFCTKGTMEPWMFRDL